jgi:hypothetical protein
VQLFRAGHSPRWEIAASLPLGVTEPQQIVNAASNRSASPSPPHTATSGT